MDENAEIAENRNRNILIVGIILLCGIIVLITIYVIIKLKIKRKKLNLLMDPVVTKYNGDITPMHYNGFGSKRFLQFLRVLGF